MLEPWEDDIAIRKQHADRDDDPDPVLVAFDASSEPGVVWENDDIRVEARLVHHESATLGAPHKAGRRERFVREATSLRERWGSWLQNDPAYNPNLDLTRRPYTLADPPRVSHPGCPGSATEFPAPPDQ